MNKRMTNELYDRILKDIQSGRSGWDIMLETGYSKTAISKIAKEHGIRPVFGSAPQWFIDRGCRFPGTEPCPNRGGPRVYTQHKISPLPDAYFTNQGLTPPPPPQTPAQPQPSQPQQSKPRIKVARTLEEFNEMLNEPLTQPVLLPSPIPVQTSVHTSVQSPAPTPAPTPAPSLKPLVKTPTASLPREKYEKAFADFKLYARELIDISLAHGREDIASVLADLIYKFGVPLNS